MQPAPATAAVQATLVPLAAGHASVDQPAAAHAQVAPFSQDAPESTFSLAQVAEPIEGAAIPVDVHQVAQHVRTAPPSYRDIRSGRAAAAAREPEAAVTIPMAEVLGTDAPSQQALPGMEGLVARVRQRTAARMSRAGSLHPA